MLRLDEGLKQFATERQIEFIDACNKEGSYRQAGRVLGVNESVVRKSIKSLIDRGAKRGFSPEHDMTRVVPESFRVKGISTCYNADGEVSQQWVKSTIDDSRLEQVLHDFVQTLSEDIKGLAPLTPPPAYSDEDLMCVYPMGDPHFGMYAWWQDAGEDFDLDIAERLTCGAVDRLVSIAPPSNTALLLNLGDMFHADNQNNTSQSGHQLDVDGRWPKVQQVGLRAMIHCIKRLLEKHQKVIFRINKGNHDGHSSYALALMISCYFHNEPRVHVDLSPAVMWYHRFGKVLLASTHGDTIKGKDMIAIMASDVPKDWGETIYRHVLVGHVHHEDKTEYRGGIVEYFPTLAARDAWHAGQGYRAGRDMRLIVMHKDHGEIERHRCDISMIQK